MRAWPPAEFRQLADLIPAIVFITDGEGALRYVNDRWRQQTGQEMEDALGLGWAGFVHSDDAPRLSEQARAAGTARTEAEFRCRDRDGQYRWFLLRSEPLLDGTGALIGRLGTSSDIHDRKLAEAALLDSERRLRLAIDVGRMAIWELDARTGDIAGSPELYRVLGFAEGETPSLDDIRQHYAPGEQERLRAIGRAAIERGDRFVEAEFQYGASLGRPRWLMLRYEVQLDANGAPERALGVVVDVTQRKLAEERLAALNQALEQAVAQRTAERDQMWRLSQDLLLVLSPQAVIEAINPAVTLLGYAPESLEGESIVGFVHPDDLGKVTAALADATTGAVAHVEMRLRAVDGSWRDYAWTGVPGEGHILAIGRDVTADKLRQAELAEAQAALRESQKLEAIGQLTGGVAHDFNNLLTPILGSLDLLGRSPGRSERERRLIDLAVRAGERAATLVQRLLAFARRQPLSVQPIDIALLVRGMDSLLASTAGPRIRIGYAFADDLSPAEADPNQLEMALLNLVANARDAIADEGNIRIEVAPAPPRDGDPAADRPGFVRLSVIDDGCGMSEETLQRAIEPFFTTKGLGKGTGLGLSTVHGLANQLGGWLDVSSRLGEGTRIDLFLPVSAPVAARVEASPAAGRAEGFAGTALLVDDEALVRSATSEMLHSIGFRVIEAGSAEQALTLVEQGLSPELLVTDHLMPGMTGTQLAATLVNRLPGLPVLIVSGYSDLAEIAPDLPRLSKPFRLEQLREAIGRIR